ncbi:DUF2996 domain-containing protein [Calothrix sp. UHCC 0171]|uniref:DUF2996 domain-containing protein n=1 Tax=Calothrix sp. UHCC 0171 TaxID=3110245 RepID=UPI002B216B2D|nr:DUF2996 domain-containing protein [Calothrix sp. UHCC 0171]MEA5569729.1 DUF2996 domain-containing protein [Calothrix sp. UHCC 0171]
MAEENNQNQAGDKVPGTDSPETTDMATANADNSANAAKPAAKKAAEGKPAVAKKEKAPTVEDKPFLDFMQQDYVPALQKAIASEGVRDLTLSFAKQQIPIRGVQLGECWQVIGSWQNGYRQFNLYFPEENIQGKKAFSCNEGKVPSTLESFLIDERKVTLDMLVSRLVYRLNGQKWLGRN